MILINVKFPVKPEYADDFPALTAEFTAATRAEDGCQFFDWFRSVEDPTIYVLVEGFDDDAAEAHVNSAHFIKAQKDFPQYLTATPKVVNTVIEGKTEWDNLVEFEVTGS